MASLRKDTEKPAALAEAGIAVVCQFGVMFFADTIRAYRAVLRVLKSGGRFVFDVWTRSRRTSLPAWLLRRVSAAYEVDKGGQFEPWEQPDLSARAPRGRHRRPRCAGNSRTWVCQRTREADCPSDTERKVRWRSNENGSQPSGKGPANISPVPYGSIRCSRRQIRRVLVAPASHSNPAPGPHGTHIRSVRH